MRVDAGIFETPPAKGFARFDRIAGRLIVMLCALVVALLMVDAFLRYLELTL
jgi:hypothetical protein